MKFLQGGRMDGRADVLLVCSSGGHLVQMWALSEAWSAYSHAWVTVDGADVRSMLERERVFYAYGPTARNLVNLFRNLFLAWRVLDCVRPQVILTTGAAIAVPFAWLSRLRRIRMVYIESLTRVERPSLTCRLVRPAVDRVYVQWPTVVSAVRGARYAGSLLPPT